jgi:hypothetical protein
MLYTALADKWMTAAGWHNHTTKKAGINPLHFKVFYVNISLSRFKDRLLRLDRLNMYVLRRQFQIAAQNADRQGEVVGRLLFLNAIWHGGALHIAKLLIPAVYNTLVMLGMLKIAFGKDQISGCGRVLCKRHIFFTNLKSRAANADIGTVAVEYLVTVICAATRAVIMIVVATVIVMALVARASVVGWSVSHSAILLSC